ncbi:hypothetical protein GW796_10310 [archaeon]|nr:hypothetical protein [archaeon]
MKVSGSKNFIGMLSEDKPLLCFFHNKKEDKNIQKIKDILIKVKKELPLLPLYEYVVDDSDENQQLCDIVEINVLPILIVYKDGCFSRYKDKKFTEAEILKFVGNKRQYVSENKF